MRTFLLVIGAVFATFLLFSLRGCSESFEDGEPSNPMGLENILPCVNMTADERIKSKSVLEIFKDQPDHQMTTAAIKFFAYPRFRINLGGQPLPAQQLCREPELDSSIADIVLQRKFYNSFFLFDDSFLGGDLLHLASALGPRDPKIVGAVGRTAFMPEAPHLIEGDPRPLARLVLAQFGSAAAAPWSAPAFAAMSADDLAGTTAVRIAIMTDHPGAIEKASELMTLLLKKHPHEEIGATTTRRLEELANAIAIAGPKAQPYVGPLIAASHRRVLGSFSSNFNKSDVPTVPPPNSSPPSYLCWPLKLIGGEKADEVLRQPWCQPVPPPPYLRQHSLSTNGTEQALSPH